MPGLVHRNIMPYVLFIPLLVAISFFLINSSYAHIPIWTGASLNHFMLGQCSLSAHLPRTNPWHELRKLHVNTSLAFTVRRVSRACLCLNSCHCPRSSRSSHLPLHIETLIIRFQLLLPQSPTRDRSSTQHGRSHNDTHHRHPRAG
jgi:hypothetical protein